MGTQHPCQDASIEAHHQSITSESPDLEVAVRMKENFQTVGSGESHPEVLHNNKRKRVHANGSDAEYVVIKPRDTTMNNHIDMARTKIIKQKHHLENEGCNKLSYQAPSSPAHPVFDPVFDGEMRKSRKTMDGNLPRVHKQSTQDKSVVHVPSKQKRTPSMEVGTKVILKSSVYPNKRHVAHASILGCN
ncbi:uncharacterized protein [Triticum aestivum]|uniref:uncharacterized protein n=1 Tax=Triticum aestivum TaxID=4565 RepID=UPI001D003793|nr:uncharacterized protein LOC123139222 [Triticum aestivum]